MVTSAFIIHYSFILFYLSYFQFYWGIIQRHLLMKKNHNSQGCWSPSWGQGPTFGASFQSFLHSYFLSTSQHPQHLIQLTNTVQRLCLSRLLLLDFVLAPHLQEQEALSYLSAINCNHCCFMTSQRSSSSRFSHCFLLCGGARWSPSFPTIQLPEVLAQMKFPACSWVRQWLNHVSQVLTFNGTWIIFEQCILLPLAYCGQLGTCCTA